MILALIGGVLIGLSAAAVLALQGRIAGVSGMLSQLVRPTEGERGWQAAFLAGLLVGGAALAALWPESVAVTIDRSWGAIALGGFLVGVGTRMGGGCTSGHGVCGNGRLSPRSIAATLTFMATGMAAVYVVDHLLGGA